MIHAPFYPLAFNVSTRGQKQKEIFTFTTMRKLLILPAIFLIQCTSSSTDKELTKKVVRDDTASMLHQYWLLEDADHPLGRDIIQQEQDRDFVPGIVFINNGQLVENPAGETYRGSYSRNNDVINVKYEDGSSGTYTIKKINQDTLFVDRDLGETVSQLLYKATNSWWPDAKENPFTANNYSWTTKPTQPESEKEIKKRCEECIRFFEYYIAGFVRGDAAAISFSGLPNCFNWYSGGIGLQSPKKLNKKWTDCFYDSTQAMQGYELIRSAIVKKYKWDENETNWMKQAVPVLKQMQDSL